MGQMQILTSKDDTVIGAILKEHGLVAEPGDTKHNWDPANKEQVAAAEELFNTLTKKKKYAAYYVDEKGKKSNKMSKFDKNASLMLLIPPIVGG